MWTRLGISMPERFGEENDLGSKRPQSRCYRMSMSTAHETGMVETDLPVFSR